MRNKIDRMKSRNMTTYDGGCDGDRTMKYLAATRNAPCVGRVPQRLCRICKKKKRLICLLFENMRQGVTPCQTVAMISEKITDGGL